jgi:hypothetical protein
MKVGDWIYCHTRVQETFFKLSDDDNYYTTVNNGYEIISIEDDYIVIINDDGGNHSFSLNKNDDEYWKKWFCDIRELRKIKLEKIKEVRKCLS